ncbi:hypothetical protein HID58_081737 [Brassica napus]|uniref:DEK-C domain-containing protein n=1 Tax=Brassica napus TaxID=3708 RepID=A0ABQ7Y8L4_BRANA|nr:hypothetical protein HID58_081737 [Brassica napus]
MTGANIRKKVWSTDSTNQAKPVFKATITLTVSDSAKMLKRNIGLFSGFVWSEEKQKPRAKEKLKKCIKEKLIDFCDVLDIPINKYNVKKEELVVTVIEFLVNPKATRDIVLAHSEKFSGRKVLSIFMNILPLYVFAPENENGGNDDTETEDEKDKAREKKSTDKKIPLKGTTKKEKPAPEEEKSLKGSAKSGRKSSKQVDKDDSSQEKGKKQTQANGSKGQGKTSKKGKREPTTKEMHVVVAKILKEVDFNTATLSDILRKLGNHFGVDLMHRKTEVRDIITDAINEMSDEDDGEENTEDKVEKYKEDGLTMCLNIG